MSQEDTRSVLNETNGALPTPRHERLSGTYDRFGLSSPDFGAYLPVDDEHEESFSLPANPNSVSSHTREKPPV